ncbi:MAG: replicative DNA helicase [candidate division Zixibacteria bacterium]|nr:replicative DNA helicase [candidate division Zixibacteria bacterium]
MERIPPHSQDAEQALLGAMLIDEGAVARAVEILRQERRFYSASHRKIYTAIIALYERSQPADITTVAEELERRGELTDCGGRAYLAGLASGVATAANAEYYARIILEKSTLRDLIEASSDIVNQAYRQEKEVDDLLDEAEQKVFDISEGQLRSDFSRIADLLPHTFEAIDNYVETKGGLIGYPTGYTDLDAITAGLHRGDLIIIAGRPSMGKSALVLNIAENLSLAASKAVAVFSLEMSKEQLALRMLCGRAKVSSHRLRTGRMSEQDWPKLSSAAGPLEKALIYIDDTPMMTVLEMRAKARRLASQADLGLIVIDYLQMMSGSRHAENRQQEISQITRGLKGLAKELNVPVVGCSQLSRMVETRGGDRRPQLSDLRESGAIEQDADVVMFVYRPEYYLSGLDPEDPKLLEVKGRAEIIIAKQRNGPTGTVMLSFLKDFARFENLAAGYGVPSEASVPF